MTIAPERPVLTHQQKRARLLKKVQKMTPQQRQQILDLARPRIVEKYLAHIPHPKQQVFLTIKGREAMYGGAAGGGKSDSLLMSALQYVDVPGYSALILRRTWPDLNSPGAILDRARTWLKPTDAVEKDGGRLWLFPSGAKLSFGYILRENDKYKFQSAEYQFVGFDELTQFSDTQYTYLFSRIRRPQLACLNCGNSVRKYPAGWAHTTHKKQCGVPFPDPKVQEQYQPAPDGLSIWDVPLRMRSATNPGGTGHQWVRDRFINPETKLDTAMFIPALLGDNPSLDQESYIESLGFMLAADRERLLNGDWDVTEEGEMFDRSWFKTLDTVPVARNVVRFWDHAASAGSGDYTVGAKVQLHEDGRWVIEDIVRGQFSSQQKERVIASTAAADGRHVPIRFEQEPGSSGKDVIDHYARNVLVGYDFRGERSTGSKEVRAQPFASAAEAGNVYMVEGRWNRDFIDEASLFPRKATHDDQIDAVSGAFSFLAFGRRGRLLV